VFHLLVTFLLGISWVASFACIEADKAEGGWLSVLGGFNLLFFLITWIDSNQKSAFDAVLMFPLLPILLLEVIGSLAVIIPRWERHVGLIVYMITDLNGRIMFNGTAYLEQGTRSEAFRIIQTAEVAFVDISFSLSFRMADSGGFTEVVMAWSFLLRGHSLIRCEDICRRKFAERFGRKWKDYHDK
jgi:hypothetical protein